MNAGGKETNLYDLKEGQLCNELSNCFKEEDNLNIFREVIEEYNDYEIATFIDADGTHTLNIIDNHQQEFDSWLVFDQINYLHIKNWLSASLPPEVKKTSFGAQFSTCAACCRALNKAAALR